MFSNSTNIELEHKIHHGKARIVQENIFSNLCDNILSCQYHSSKWDCHHQPYVLKFSFYKKKKYYYKSHRLKKLQVKPRD